MIFLKPAEFYWGARKPEELPKEKHPELVFYGRSNVGKSSLINALVNRKSLVRTSKTPGHTSQINFFEIDQKIYLVDLPGYGFAKASKKEQTRWNHLLMTYFETRRTIKTVCIIIDARHGLKEIDQLIMNELDRLAISYFVLLTKIDKVKSKQELISLKEKTEEKLVKHPAAFTEVKMSSSVNKTGIPELRKFLQKMVIS